MRENSSHLSQTSAVVLVLDHLYDVLWTGEARQGRLR